MIFSRATGALTVLLLLLGVANAAPVCTLVKDIGTGQTLEQEGDCARRLSPASTFKIPLSLMGYDAGFLTDKNLPLLPFHEGYIDTLPEWKQSISPTTWLQYSAIWYSQQLTEWLGEARLKRYITTFSYGNKDLSGDPGKNNGLTQAWLSSSLKISPLEQVDFLRKVIRRQLFISKNAYEMTSKISEVGMVSGWTINGKTGTGYLTKEDGSLDSDRQFGWFIGWARRGNQTLAFAQTVEDEQKEGTPAGLRAKTVLMARLTAILKTF